MILSRFSIQFEAYLGVTCYLNTKEFQGGTREECPIPYTKMKGRNVDMWLGIQWNWDLVEDKYCNCEYRGSRY